MSRHFTRSHSCRLLLFSPANPSMAASFSAHDCTVFPNTECLLSIFSRRPKVGAGPSPRYPMSGLHIHADSTQRLRAKPKTLDPCSAPICRRIMNNHPSSLRLVRWHATRRRLPDCMLHQGRRPWFAPCLVASQPAVLTGGPIGPMARSFCFMGRSRAHVWFLVDSALCHRGMTITKPPTES